MDSNEQLSIITNIYIFITFLFSIILIFDELYNIGVFTFKYTYNYNYGSMTQDFNNIQTIEYETKRFNVYNNIKFLRNDIFNKTYFNILIKYFITLITILCCISYGVYFYNRFISNNAYCIVDDDIYLSFPKKLLKCICNDCHKIIPNCTIHNIVLFIIIIIYPLIYIFKLLFNINLKPSNYIYIILFTIFLFTYIYNIITDTDIPDDLKNKEIVIFLLFTIIFIASGYIYDFIYYKYNNIYLNTDFDENTIFDIYKQSTPIKPSPINKPVFNNISLLNTFKYNANSTDIDYKAKKDLVDTYYNNIKEYNNELKIYTDKLNIYKTTIKNVLSKTFNFGQYLKDDINIFSDKTNYFDITIKMLGFNNIHIIIIILLLIFSFVLYYIYNNDYILVCAIYLMSVLTLIILINAILYYNTYFNKYIIYEPLAYYKNDITKANTKFNLYLNPTNGNGFYNKLVNNIDVSYTILEDKSKFDILSNINYLTNINNYNFDSIDSIDTAINNDTSLISINNDNIIDSILYYTTTINPLETLIINNFKIITSTKSNNYPILDGFKFHYSNTNIQLFINFNLYYEYIYYLAYQYLAIINKIITFNNLNYPNNITKDFQLKFNNIVNTYEKFKNFSNDISFKANINTDVNTKIINTDINSNKNNIINVLETFENNYIYNIKIDILLKTIKTELILSIYKIKLDDVSLEDNTNLIASIVNSSTQIIPITYPNMSIIPNFKKSNISYYEYPNKITDKFNNEYILDIDNTKLSISAINMTINANQKKPINLLIKSKSNENTIVINKILDDNIYINDTNINNIITLTSKFYIPSNIYINDITTQNNFNRIILAILYNDLTNITTQFTYLNLQKILAYNNATETIITNKPTASEITSILINKTYTYKYTDSFNKIDLTSLTKQTSSFLNITGAITTSTDLTNYIVLLFNIYKNSSFPTDLSSILEYIIYNKTESEITAINIDSFFINDLNLNTNLTSIKTSINYKSVVNKELIDYYVKNKYVINLIFKLYYNMLNYIRNQISKQDTENLCFSTDNKYAIEQYIFNHLNLYFNLPTILITTKPSGITIRNSDTIKNNKIIKINNHITNFFNIILYILKNLNSGNDTLNIERDNILTNYKFYNPDIYNINDFVIKELKINCNYFNKYNNMDTSQKELFKRNINNVGYNFPILMVIIFIILGQSAFIKS